MYIPKHYLATDRAEIVAFMKQYSFATIVTVKDNLQTATHLPFVVTEEDDKIILTSHFAKANQQWREIIENKVLIIFTEPHAYISPKHYDKDLNVPTWNYISIHTYGQGQIITDNEKTVKVLEKMIDNYEADYRKQWDGLPADYKHKMLNGIVAFEIVVTDLQAKKKLSQNKTEAERARIIETFSKSENENEKQIADFMKKDKIEEGNSTHTKQ